MKDNRHHRLTALLLILVLMALLPAGAQDMFTVHHYGTHDGMPHNLAQCYIQDSKGFLWAGTRNGLTRFDGITFHNYKISAQDGFRMSSNRIKNIWASSTDKIWIQTFDSLIYLLDPKTGQFRAPLPQKTPHSRVKVTDMEGGITYVLADYQCLYRFDENDPHFMDVAYQPRLRQEGEGLFYTVFQDSQRREWLLGSQGVGLLRGDSLTLVSPTTYDKMWEADGRLLLASKRGELAMVTTGPSPVITTLARGPKNFTEIFPSSDNAFMVKTSDAVYLYHLNEGVLSQPEQLWEGSTPINREMMLGSNGAFWAFTPEGDILRRDPYTHEAEVMALPRPESKLGEKSIRLIHEDRYGHVWVLTDEGLICHYNEEYRRMEAATYHQGDGEHSYVERVRYFFADRDRNLWLSTTDGMDLIAFRPQEYEWISSRASTGKGEVVNERQDVRCVFEDGHCNLWVGSQDKRVVIYDRNGRRMGNLTPDGRVVPQRDAGFGIRVYCMMQDRKGNLWMGTRGDGVYVLRPSGPQAYTIRRFRHDKGNPYSLSSNEVFALYEDALSRVWVGTFGGGLCLAQEQGDDSYRFVHKDNDMTAYPAQGFHRIRCLNETGEGVMMVGTTDGLLTFELPEGLTNPVCFYRNTVANGRNDGLNSNDISHLMQDRTGRVFISTMDGGINVAASQTDLLTDSIPLTGYTQRGGLLTDVVVATMEDLSGRIWVVAPNSFSRWNLEQGTFDHIKPDFLKSQITLNECLPAIDHNGDFVLGTTNGALRLLANQFTPNPLTPPLSFDQVLVHDEATYVKSHPDGCVDLQTTERNFTISFIALDYSNPTEIQYAYRLRENGDRWIQLGKNRQVNFPDITPGKHTFEVKSTNGDGVWRDNIATLTLNVIPTFWETGYATALYVFLIIVIILLSAGIIAYITGLRQAVSFERRLTEMKLRFFTDISHELRTPLTLIAGPIDEVLQKEALSEGGRNIMLTARRNTDQMLRLVSQILDFKKVQTGKMKVRLEQTDVEVLTHRIFLNFAEMAKQRGMTYTHDGCGGQYLMLTDADKVEKILTNLLSNAFKYTPEERRITLRTRVDDGHYVIQVIDEGKGFDVKEKSRLFLRFETDDEANPRLSSGIGLALTKELVRILHGTLDAESTLGKGSTFTVSLPTDSAVFREDSNVTWTGHQPIAAETQTATTTAQADDRANVEESGEASEGTADRPRLLIIDDNPDLRQFIRHVLSDEYDILEAADGSEGLEKSRASSPDLVLSDIMMPVMDGIAYLNALKTDPATSHIPVILLTAKTSIDDQIQGMECGADDYITKPFNTALLRAKITALLRRRAALLDHFLNGKAGDVQVQSDAGSWEPSKPQITQMDHAFITQVMAGIEAHMGDPDFKIEVLASEMNVSRSVFYRKIKGIMGLSPIDLVKTVRIRRVTELMREGITSVTEMAYRCGFSSPQYLSRLFKEVTGSTPTEYVRKLQGKS